MKARASEKAKKNQENRSRSVWDFWCKEDSPRDSVRHSMAADSDELGFIKKLINIYFNIVRRNLIDYIPKTIITMLVNESVENCDRELVSSLYKEDKVDELLSKNSDLHQRQKEIESDLTALRECQRILDQFERISHRGNNNSFHN